MVRLFLPNGKPTCQYWHMPTGAHALPSRLSQEVGRILTEAIARGATSQARVAEAAGISASQLSRALAGKKVFTLDQLDSVCTSVGLDIVDVIAAADQSIPERAPRRPIAVLRRPSANVGDRPDTDLETVELDITKLAASRDNTPIDPSHGEG
ncbi:helix-turn-helix transcriptional regulator [Microbacterium oryzae]|uniref:helix-turn-helix domain-containing protein n=1 Tax=Microbacterium oryzae TaxID=743009 RepID=UPI0025B0F1BF|nr:helix-turn-helix transcriptional regulator [Microbacterium oryzae]MDN3309596.1 helix-turn-helix transcriptional regulator [Microbacterium oryzae]